MRKRIIGLAVVIVAALSMSAVAFANNGATVTKFKATYGNPTSATTWTCTGNHIINKGAGVQDSETCLLTGDLTGFVPGTYIGNPFVNFPPVGLSQWNSDFNGAVATSWTLNLVDNGNGTDTANITAFYAS